MDVGHCPYDAASQRGPCLCGGTTSRWPKDTKGGEADTAEAYDILDLTVTIRDIDLGTHTVAPANPSNVKVNLFDYWVKTKDPSVGTGGDILSKSDVHYHEDGGEGALGDTPTGYSTVEDWNMGINQGHLLLFGDGMIHAGLWNKGAGENCRYGNTYAGMEGIVKKVLDESGYPELDLAMANGILTGDDTRDYTLIKDYALTGDHEDVWHDKGDGYAYSSTDIQNLSKTLLQAWGKGIDAGESLRYLFDPADGHSYKTSYTDVTGLFQLDEHGYYYYNMRKNFAEFSQAGGTNHFILYDAPATTRTDTTDNEPSIGNFFPFNKGSEVFNGMDASGKLTSSVDCARNAMNHHLGMTVEVEFRQPANGKIGAGASSQPMTFEFAGDDDVWVFIDDVLVLDLGGIHSEIYGTINFATGDVYIGRAFASKGIPNDPENPKHMVMSTTLRAAYEAAGMGSATQWNGNTFASNTSHTLKMFYLERGNYDSSIALRFNLQPLLYHRIEKVDQNGQPLEGVEFTLYPAYVTNDTSAIQCLYTDDTSVNRGQVFYVQPNDSVPLVTLQTGSDGSAVFQTPEGFFNFADRGDQYYVLRETKAPNGYRAQPIDVVLHYDTSTAMLSVANRWTTGAYACSISNVSGSGMINYGVLGSDGAIQATGGVVSDADQANGLVVAVPLLEKRSDSSWLALHGSNLRGFGSVPVGSTEAEWLSAVLLAALEQAGDVNTADWHLEWDGGNNRLYGMLYDLPGVANRYQLNDPSGDMRMVYGIISDDGLRALGIAGSDAAERYDALRQYVRTNGTANALNAILGAGNGFRFLSVDQFTRSFRSLIYMPNERRELRVLKVNQKGEPLSGAVFGLFDGGTQVASGITDDEGMLIFSPTGNGTPGQAQMVWANRAHTQYILRETQAPAGYSLNAVDIPVVVGTYGIYADAGVEDDGVKVMAGVGTLTQTMRQYAMGGDVDVTLQDITAFMQTQPSGAFDLTGWNDAKLDGTNITRSMNLHFGKNAVIDYGLHDADGGKLYEPFFVTDTGFVRARVQQNFNANSQYQDEGTDLDANMENLGNTDLTNLFSLLNVVVVTDGNDSVLPPPERTGQLTISKKVTGTGLTAADYIRNYIFEVDLKAADGSPLEGSYKYRFYGDDKSGYVSSGESLVLHHDESITILGLPVGTRWTVTEVDPMPDWHVTVKTKSGTVSGATVSGEVAEFETDLAEFTNSKDKPDPTGSLIISKRVEGDMLVTADYQEDFTFTVVLKKDGQPLAGEFVYEYILKERSGMISSGGSLDIHHGEQVIIRDLPVGTQFTVTEQGKTGWTPASGMIANSIAADGTVKAEFTNRKDPGVTPTPDPSVTPTPTPDPSVTPTPTPDPGVTPTPTPDPSVTPTPTPDPSVTPTPTPDPSVTPTPTPDPSVTPTPTPDPSVTPTPGGDPDPTPTATADSNIVTTPPDDPGPKDPNRPGGPNDTDLPDDGLPQAGADAPETPPTGDSGMTRLWMAVNILSLSGLVVIYFARLRKKRDLE